MKKVVITYIGGGSKDWAQKYFADLLSQDKLCGEIRLYDINVAAAELNSKVFEKLKVSQKKNIKSEWTAPVYTSLAEALKGSDFVLLSILPYTLKNMKVDVHYPEKYGIYQSVGDTVGPGGYTRALRTLPYYIEFAEAIKKYCPNAWVINYTNPMTMCTNALYKAFPEIKAIGCCHEVFGTQTLVAKIMELYLSLSEAGKQAFMEGDLRAVKKDSKQGFKLRPLTKLSRRDISVNVQGVNHFTSVNKITYKDMDVMPIVRAYIRLFRMKNAAVLRSGVSYWIKYLRNRENVKFEVFENFGVLGAAGDRHLSEFMPEKYLPLGIKNNHPAGVHLTTVKFRVWRDNQRRRALKKAVRKGGKAHFRTSGEEGVQILTALAGQGDWFSNCNVPNNGQIPNLPMGTCVETNAQFSKDSVKVVDAGEMSEPMRSMVERHALNQRDFIDAFFAKDKKAVLEVFLNDPSVARIGRVKGEKLFNEMVALNADCLEDWIKA